MKHIFTTIALFAIAISFTSCEKEIIVNCNCQCNNSNGSDQNTGRPNNGGNTGNNGGNTGDNGGNTGDNGGNSGGNSGEINREDYETINCYFTQGQAGYYGVYYEDQPSNTANWYLELAESNYDLENYEGEGYNISIEFFTNSSSTTSIPAGEYTIEAFKKNEYSAGSILDGFIAEDDTYGDYPAGTWIFEGNEGIAGATAGSMTITVSGDQYNIDYSFFDDEYQVAFCGSYSGDLTIYDGTEGYSYSQATKSPRSGDRHYRVRL
jgi:hypothetical protein